MKHTKLPFTAGENGAILDADGLVVCRIRKWRMYQLGDEAAVAEQKAVQTFMIETLNKTENYENTERIPAPGE